MGVKKQIIYKNVEDLVPYENNPRINDEAVKYVVKSIENFKFQNPIIIDSNNIIICGHTRLKAAKELGMEEVPCIVADDLTEEQVKAFRLADNKVGEIAQWDIGMLEAELEELDLDMTDFGFIELADLDVDSFFEDAAPKDEPDGEPEEEEVQCPHCGMFFKVN